MKCEKCQQEVFLPFRCPYCSGYFCSEHRLPENHDCPRIEEAHAQKNEEQTISIQRQTPYEYTFSYAPMKPKTGRIYFSNKEIQHLAIAAALVTALGLSLGTWTNFSAQTQEPIMLGLFTTFLTSSFFMHEIAHKIAAQKRGLWAEFRLTLLGAVLTLFSIVSPFKVISPGAVMVAGSADKENIGKISIAGPTTNILLSIAFLAIALLIPKINLTPILLLSAAFNAWIALFNLIPFGILDGFKIFQWSKRNWILAFSASLALTFVSYWLIL